MIHRQHVHNQLNIVHKSSLERIDKWTFSAQGIKTIMYLKNHAISVKMAVIFLYYCTLSVNKVSRLLFTEGLPFSNIFGILQEEEQLMEYFTVNAK